ncbi:ribonuclease H-like [Bombina bombina]|uniref:ribonuclease H-like n=1 Tax=Bombina bombina TaxID=8345 RepID=UPI00235AEC17|nr:ribonuclease H-like [Bombina bombina]
MYCQPLPKLYVDGCAFHTTENGERKLVALAGIVWGSDYHIQPVGYCLGPKSSQMAELSTVYKAIQMEVNQGFKEFVIITDSDYVRNSFAEYLPVWKHNQITRARNKPVKHGKMILAIDDIVISNDLIVFWKKTKGH